jgi:hypothetical protein
MKRTILRGVVALACVTSLSACSGRSGTEKVVRDGLKDPDSAKFGEYYFNAKTKKGCLEVNAKNSMGGYTGNQLAYVKKTDAGWESIGTAEIDMQMCRKIHADAAG